MWLMPKSIELERRRSKKRRNDKSRMYKYGKRDAIIKKVSEWEGRGILWPEYRIGRKRE